MTAIDDYTAAAQALAAAVQAAASSPGDAIRILSDLAGYAASVPPYGADPIGMAMTAMASACDDLLRRSAVIALAVAATTYQPTSATDAIDTLAALTDIIDAEIEIAGDQFDDATYSALKALRNAVVQDLTTRGATLAPIITFVTAQPMPANVLAGRYYNDPSRGDQLVIQVNPIHPLFMPTEFEALAR